MTKIFYDCEFIEDGKTVDLISFGAVDEHGRTLYLVNEEVGHRLYQRICEHEWLMDNVVPHLPLSAKDGQRTHGKGTRAFSKGFFNLDFESNVVVPARFIRNAVREFIQETPTPQLWAWYGAYDHVCYAQLFGRMIDLPDGFPMHTNDIKTLYELAGNPAAPEQTGGEHNALADAIHNRERYLYVARILQDRMTRGLVRL